MKCSAFDRAARFGFILLIVVLAGLGTAHILARTATYGTAFGTDSALFLSTAMNFLAGEGWRDFGGAPLVGWPPLFPLLLAAFGWVGIEPLEAGRWINAAAFGLTILVAGLYLRSQLRLQGLALAASVVIAASVPLSYFAAGFLTDPLFVLFTLLALIQLAAFLQRGGWTPLLWGAVFTALAALTRYPGVVLIGTGVLLLLPLARLRHTLAFGACSSLPLLPVLAHNWTVSGSLAGVRKGSDQPLSEGLSQTANIFWKWAIPPHGPDELVDYLLWRVTGLGAPDWFGSLLWTTTGLVVAAAVAVVVLSGRGLGMGGNRTAPAYFGLVPALLFGGFASVYLACMVVVFPLMLPVAIYDRYLLPVYVPLLLAAVLLLDRFLSIEVAGRVAVAKWGLASLVLLGASAHIGFSVQRNLHLTTQAYVSGFPEDGAYNVAYWRHHATLNYVKAHLRDGRIYSNNPFVVYFAARTAAFGQPPNLPSELRNWTQDARWWVEGGEDEVYIVWIKGDYRAMYHDYNHFDIRFLPGVEVVADLSDGVVFRVTAVKPFDEDRVRAEKKRYQERYVEQLLAQAGERVVRADWDVYRKGHKLTYFKKPCAPADVQAKFILHIFPADPGVLSIARRRHGFDNLGFHFDQLSTLHAMQVADQCIAIVELPDYAIDRIRVGQWIANENRTRWDAEFPASR